MRPEKHGSGYGKAISQKAEGFVSTGWGANCLEMDNLNTRVQLGAWYQRCGDITTDKRREFLYGDNRKGFLTGRLELLVIGTDLIVNEGS